MAQIPSHHVLLFIFLPSAVLLAPPPTQGPLHYGVVVDAGSSGSRSRVYAWPAPTDPNKVPNITEVFEHAEEPGISDFADNLDGLTDYVQKLITVAAEQVPREQHHSTILYFMATAGMRLLLEEKANAMMERINDVLLQDDVNPFQYNPLNTRILSGEEEGVFAWISLNYLNGFFDKRAVNPAEQSTGIMEMGGASLQIAFQPEGSILADKFPVKVGGQIYPLYVHSFLYYGQNYADRWVKQYLYGEAEDKNDIENPCMLRDDVLKVKIHDVNVTFIGTGKPAECADIIDVFVYKVDPRRCHPKPCSIGAVYQPSITPYQRFSVVGAFLFPLKLLNVLKPDKTFSLRETNSSAYEYCMKDINTVKNETGRRDNFLSVECLTALYIPHLFVEAFGFHVNTTQINAVKKINGQPSEWALGAIIYETERRRDKECIMPSKAIRSTMMASACCHLPLSWNIILAVSISMICNCLLTFGTVL